MNVADVLAVVVAGLVAVAAVGLLVVLRSLTRTLRLLRRVVDDLERETVPLVHDLRATAQQARHDLDHVDSLLSSAETVGTTVEAASRLAYATFSNPVVKAMSLGAGVARAGKRLRSGR